MMMKRKNNRLEQSGFSIVELMIVMVIIGLLASLGVPIYTSNMKKVKMSEANASLASIRDHLRVYYAENEGDGGYPDGEDVLVHEAWWSGIKESELQGLYFAPDNYTYTGGGDEYVLSCTNNHVLDSPRTLDQDGNFAGGLD